MVLYINRRNPQGLKDLEGFYFIKKNPVELPSRKKIFPEEHAVPTGLLKFYFK